MNLILMIPLKQGGLALATVISSLVNNTLLLIILSRQGFGINVKTLLAPLRSLLLSLFAGAIIRYALDYAGYGAAGCGNIIKDIILLIVISALFGSAYLLGSWICRAGELREVSSLLLRRKKHA
jgi:putative peptidoglycan lipid II flippase